MIENNSQPAPASPQADPGEYTGFVAELYTHADSLFRLGMVLSRDPNRAEDLVQETFLRALRSKHQFQPGTRLKSWLVTILRNSFINQYRLRRRSLEVSVSDFEGLSHAEPELPPRHATSAKDHRQPGGPDRSDFYEELDEQVKRALLDLPEERREILLLAVIEELTYKEIAAILDIPVGTVMSRLFRARRQLQEQLGEFRQAWGVGLDDATEHEDVDVPQREGVPM